MQLDRHSGSGLYLHVFFLGRCSGIWKAEGLKAWPQAVRRQEALTVLAHPHRLGNSLADAVRWQRDRVEIYNHVCH